MDTSGWAVFPYQSEAYSYPGESLNASWNMLHRGDAEPLPDNSDILEAWRHYHAGDFAGAFNLALEIGPDAHAVANKASGIYADYLEDDENTRLAIYKSGIKRAEKAISSHPNDANAHYFHAFLLGRYSQNISITKALSQGIGGKVRESLQNTLKLAPKHAEAHTALGLYHAEIIGKIGKMVGRLTYGASVEEAFDHFEQALSLTPDAPIAHLEYGNGLYLMFGDRRLEESNAAYKKAASIKPVDAMQRLDMEFAKASI